jgi:elongation factor G
MDYQLPAPWPLLQVAIEPLRETDRGRLRLALSAIAREDTSFSVTDDDEAGQILIGSIREDHLDAVIGRLRTKFGIDFRVGSPRVAYRETITRSHVQDYSHKRLVGNAGEFARVRLLFEPNPLGSGFVFKSMIEDDVVPKDYVLGIELSIEKMMQAGPFAGFPVVALKATLVDAAFHDTDSSARVFERAARDALKEAIPQLGFQLLEPVMKVLVSVQDVHAPSVVDELEKRRGVVVKDERQGHTALVHAIVPLASTFNLQNSLLSRSGGTASFTASYSHYSSIPQTDGFEPPPAMAVA